MHRKKSKELGVELREFRKEDPQIQVAIPVFESTENNQISIEPPCSPTESNDDEIELIDIRALMNSTKTLEKKNEAPIASHKPKEILEKKPVTSSVVQPKRKFGGPKIEFTNFRVPKIDKPGAITRLDSLKLEPYVSLHDLAYITFFQKTLDKQLNERVFALTDVNRIDASVSNTDLPTGKKSKTKMGSGPTN